MSLRVKTLVAIGFLFLILLGLLYALIRGVLFNDMQAQEEQNAIELLSQFRWHLKAEENQLALRAGDWSAWDETYRFVQDRNRGFIEHNLGNNVLRESDLDLVAFYDTQAKLIYAKSYDRERQATVEIESAMLAQLQALAQRVDCNRSDGHQSGMLLEGDRVWMAIASPVLTSGYAGPCRGVMIIGQDLDQQQLKDYGWTTAGQARLCSFGKAPLDSASRARLTRRGEGSVAVISRRKAVDAYLLLQDAFGAPEILLYIQVPHMLMARGLQLERMILLGLCILTLLFAAVMLGLLESTVLRPLYRLSAGLAAIGASGDLSRRFGCPGRDELSQLANSLNYMLDQLSQSDAVVRESEWRYRFLYNNTPVMLHSIDSTGRLVSVSDYWLENLGYRREEVLGRRSTDFLTLASRKYALETVLPDFYATGVMRDIPYQIIRKDGSIVDILMSAIAERDEDGVFVRSLAVLVDVTERKRVEEEIVRRAGEIQAITAAFPDLYFRIDKDGKYLDFLGGRLEDLAVPPAQFLGRNQHDVLPAEVADKFDAAIEQTFDTGGLVAIDYRMQVGGRLQDFEARLVPLGQEQLLTVVRNITAKKRAELVQEVLLRITEAVSTSANLYSLLATVHDELERLINVNNFYVALYNPITELYEFPYHIDEADVDFGPQSMPGSLTDYVRRTGKGLYLTAELQERLTAAGEFKPLGPLANSWIGAPLNTAQGTIGVVVVQSYYETGLYTMADLEVLALVSSDIAMAIERKQAQDALTISEERYRSFVAQSSEGIWRFELDAPIDPGLTGEEQLALCMERAYLAECNDAMAQMYGFAQAADLIGARLTDMLAPDEPRNREFLMQFFNSGHRIQEAESVELDREGRKHYFLNSMVGLKENGMLVRGWGMQRDITKRRSAEEALKASEEHLRQVIDLVPHFIFAKDEQGRFILVNEAMAQAYGATVGELIGKRDADFTATQEEAQRFASDDLEVVRTGKPRLIPEEPITDAQGNTRLLQTLKIPFTYNGQPAMLGVSTDITDRKRVEEALREREESYRRLVELAQEGIVTVDIAERITFCNPAFVTTLGYTREDELLGRSLLEFVDAGYHQAVRRGSEKRQHGDTSTYEVVMLARTGEKKTFFVTASPLFDRLDQYEGALGVLTDVTERKRAEQALAYAQKLESLGVLAGGIAHDFNNLLVGVMGNAGLALREMSVSSAARRYILDIEMASQRAADLTRQMLAYSGKGQLSVQTFDLSQAVEEITRLLEAAIPRNVILKFDLARDLPAVEADSVQIRQVAMNLILNAAEAIGEASGIVTVATGAVEADSEYLATSFLQERPVEGLYVFLEVSDTGCGMDSATREKIFDPFFTTKFTGRGLGLAAVLGIVRAHQGSIKVYSEPGRGSTFKVLLPASAQLFIETVPAVPAQNAWRGEGTVLVVDDEPTVRAVAKRVLEQQGFSVLTAADGEEGLALFKQRQAEIALVLLDMTMPKLSGEEAYREMRRVQPDVCVVLSSGYNEHDATTRFSGKGLAGFLQKPYSPSELLSKVRGVLDSAAAAALDGEV
jgi:PAS domain S-box-containing protein